jgi:hypothetical protein
MVRYYPGDAKSILNNDSGTDNDESDMHDAGRDVVERNRQERARRMAENTKDELDKVLKRVDNVGSRT